MRRRREATPHGGARRLVADPWRTLVVAGVVLVSLGSTAMPPIVAAAKDQEWGAVRALVESRADVDEAAPDGATALHWASYWDELGVSEVLLSAGADPNVTTDLGVTPLWTAAQNGSPRMVRQLLEAGADPSIELVSGETPVMTGSLTGSAEVVRRLLEAGADPNGSATRGQTALMWAAGQGHSEVVATLLEFGADVDARTEIRHQYMKTDKGQESHPAYQVWVDAGGSTPLFFAARSGDLPSVRMLVEAGADVNATDASGITPTIMAVHTGEPGVVEFLLRHGADPDAGDAGHTALHAAILRGNEEAVRALLDAGANPNRPVTRATPTRRQSLDYHFHDTWVGATPLWLAARFTEPTIMRDLLEVGADPLFAHDVSYPAGNRERHRIEHEGEVTVLMAALGMGNRRLRTGFHRPPEGEVEARTLDAVKVAVDAGVDVRAADASGQTALDAARARGYDAVVDFLVERGALEAVTPAAN